MSNINSITCKALNDKLKAGQDDFILLDVREENEVEICRIEPSMHIPMNLIPIYLDQIPDDKTIVIYCHHGIRSMNVAHYLVENGFDENLILNLDGGINAWATDIDSKMRQY